MWASLVAREGLIEGIPARIESMRARKGRIPMGIESMRARKGRIPAGIESMRARKGRIPAGIESMRARKGRMRAGIESMRARKGRMRAGIESMRARKGRMRAGIESMRARMTSGCRSVRFADGGRLRVHVRQEPHHSPTGRPGQHAPSEPPSEMLTLRARALSRDGTPVF